MYGTYREEKFEAMGMTLRLESFATALFEKLVESLNLKFITKSTLLRIHEYLWLYMKALDLEGMATEGLVAKLRYLTSALPIGSFQSISTRHLPIHRQGHSGYHPRLLHRRPPRRTSPLRSSVRSRRRRTRRICGAANGPSRMNWFISNRRSFIRGIISSAFGLQVLDNFIHAVIRTLNAELEKFKDNKRILNLLMDYNPELAVSSIYSKNARLDNQILLGNKGYFLKKLVSFGFPVPPGFIITTEVFRGYDAVYGYKYIFEILPTGSTRKSPRWKRKPDANSATAIILCFYRSAAAPPFRCPG